MILSLRRFFAGMALLFIAAGLATWWIGVFDHLMLPELARAAEASTQDVRLAVGESTHVSGALPNAAHYGCTLAADPTHPDRLFVTSNPVLEGKFFAVVGYYSHDGGATWKLGCERRGENVDERCCDDALAFAPDSTLVLAHMRGDYGNDTIGVKRAQVDVLCSADGGKTWVPRSGLDGFVDRPQLTFDGTGGRYHSRLYCNACEIVEGPPSQKGEPIALRSYARVYQAANANTQMHSATRPKAELLTTAGSNPVVVADGTVVVAYFTSERALLNPHRIAIWRSDDGGETYTEAHRVPTSWVHPTMRASGVGHSKYPRLAAAPAKAPTADQLYCVWDDGPYVVFSSSVDHGDTWSAPILLSEQPSTSRHEANYEAGMPAIAVNNRGDIAVAWFDRRGLPAAEIDTGGVIHTAGYNFRIRVSTDGGRSWLPSVQLNDKPGMGDPIELRFWGVGLAAAADDRFHAAWVSDCDGTQQLWANSVLVDPVLE